MGRQIEIGTVRDALEFAEFARRETETVFNIDGALGIV